MFIERDNSNASPIETDPLPPFAENAQDFVSNTLRLTHLQKQLGYSSQTMDQILPITVTYYLLSKANRKNDSFEGSGIAQAYVIAAMRVYPKIIDEITVEHYPRKSLDARDPHDVAICLGERLALHQATTDNEFTLLKRVKRDVEKIREVANTRKRQVTRSA